MFGPPGDLDGGDAHGEPGSRALLVLVDKSKEPGDGARHDAELLGTAAASEHRPRLACTDGRKQKVQENRLHRTLPRACS